MPYELATVSFQYMAPGDELPTAGYELTDASFDLPPGVPLPRTGEFMQFIQSSITKSYVVLAVQTRVFMVDETRGWHTVITLGPTDEVADPRLLAIRE